MTSLIRVSDVDIYFFYTIHAILIRLILFVNEQSLFMEQADQFQAIFERLVPSSISIQEK